MTYSIPELLKLSASPLARLSHEQERDLHRHLYLASTWNRSKHNANALTSTAPAPTTAVNNAPDLRDRQRLNRRRGNVRRNAIGMAMKRRNGWEYGNLPTAGNSDWRRTESDRFASAVALGA